MRTSGPLCKCGLEARVITFKIKDSFFDRQKVIRELSAGKRKALSRAGAFIRTRAKSSMRRRKYGTYSKPGSPPYAHGSAPLKKFLYFGYDRASESVVVGPVGFRNSRVPALQEFGGVGQTSGSVRRRTNKVVGVYEPRPYMGPALEKERQNIPRAFRGSVNKG